MLRCGYDGLMEKRRDAMDSPHAQQKVRFVCLRPADAGNCGGSAETYIHTVVQHVLGDRLFSSNRTRHETECGPEASTTVLDDVNRHRLNLEGELSPWLRARQIRICLKNLRRVRPSSPVTEEHQRWVCK